MSSSQRHIPDNAQQSQEIFIPSTGFEPEFSAGQRQTARSLGPKNNVFNKYLSFTVVIAQLNVYVSNWLSSRCPVSSYSCVFTVHFTCMQDDIYCKIAVHFGTCACWSEAVYRSEVPAQTRLRGK